MTDLSSLIARVEALTDPKLDPLLGDDVLMALGWWQDYDADEELRCWMSPDIKNWKEYPLDFDPTRSVDAVLALIAQALPGSVVEMSTMKDGLVGGHADVFAVTSQFQSYHAIHGQHRSTPEDRKPLALALLLAALRAIQSINDGAK